MALHIAARDEHVTDAPWQRRALAVTAKADADSRDAVRNELEALRV